LILFHIFEEKHRKFLTADVEGNAKNIRVARDGVESVLDKLGAGNLCIEITNIVGIPNNKGSSLEKC
jgi:hypothetical protein